MQNLPRATEQELRYLRREYEREREASWERVREVELARRKRAMLEGALLFFALNLYIFGLSVWALPLSPLFGALTGLAWHALRTEAVLSALTAMPIYAALALLLGAVGAGDAQAPAHALIFGTLAVGPVSMALGIARSMGSAGA